MPVAGGATGFEGRLAAADQVGWKGLLHNKKSFGLALFASL